MANGTFRHPWILCVLTAGSVFGAAAIAATAEQTPAAPAQDAAAQPASSATPAAPPADSASKPAASNSHKVVLVDNDVTDIQLKQILAKGYRPESKGGKTVYCRKEAQLGSRFETKTCATSATILATEQLSREQTAQGQRVVGQGPGK